MATIVTKNSSTASAVPTTSDLVQGELAVNVTDKRIFTENASTQIVELGTSPSSITTATATVTGTLTANGTFASSNAVLTGGSINSTPIGATTPSTIVGSTVTANTGFVGGLTGNVTGNLTGNVTGNVVGDLTGNVTGNVTAASGTTTLNDLVVNGTADFTNTKLTNVVTPTAGTDAANKTYVDDTVAAVINAAPAALDTLNELAAALGDDADFAGTVTTALATKLPLAGGTMTGAIAMGTAKITGLGDPTSAQDAATKTYVDTQDATKLSTTGGTMSGAIAMGTNKITGVGDPTLAQDAATKAYTDSILGSATSAADSAEAAATSASNASTSASNASTSEGNASTSADNAASSAAAAATTYDNFDDRYLGQKASDPTLDNDGDALLTGALYFNTASDAIKVYDGASWVAVAPTATSVTVSQISDYTGTATELNYTDGVTSNIQTQLNAKGVGSVTSVGGTGTVNGLNLTGTVTSSGNLTLGGTFSATVSEISDLTATATELNYTDGVTSNIQSQLDAQVPIASFTWDSSTTSPAAVTASAVPQFVLDNLYNQIKGCILNADGTVNYYLKSTDWSEKADGTSSDLTGTDGNVMVEIPKFYYRTTFVGTVTTWEISPIEVSGFAVHPAFIVDGAEVDKRYYSAYDACVYDDSASAYISGTNLDDNSGNVDTSADKLSSVKGIYPMVGLTRNQFRLLAAVNGAGWRQLDFYLWSAVGLLYAIEYQTFFNQDELGNGNTNGGYLTSSSDQNDSPHTIAGYRDDVANGSTTSANGQGAATKPGTVAMKYRGIENLFGNCWNWADAININVSGTGNVHVATDNDRANYADNTSTNYTLITSSLTTGTNNIQSLLPLGPYFLASSVGGSSSQYVTDKHYGSASSNRVARVGGDASFGGDAGVFALPANLDSGLRHRSVGGRLAR